jgi:iron complex transport system ATP-binding protein
LFLDEPLTFLDIRHQIEFMKKVREFAKGADVVAIGVVHDLNLAARFADQVVLMNEGKLVASGLANDVLTTERIHYVFGVQPTFIRSSDDRNYIVFD